MIVNLIKHQEPDIENIYLYVKYPFEWMYQLIIKNLKNPKAFIDYSQTIDDVYKD